MRYKDAKQQHTRVQISRLLEYHWDQRTYHFEE